MICSSLYRLFFMLPSSRSQDERTFQFRLLEISGDRSPWPKHLISAQLCILQSRRCGPTQCKQALCCLFLAGADSQEPEIALAF